MMYVIRMPKDWGAVEEIFFAQTEFRIFFFCWFQFLTSSTSQPHIHIFARLYMCACRLAYAISKTRSAKKKKEEGKKEESWSLKILIFSILHQKIPLILLELMC